mgnify:CR=1 FL=1
MSSSQSHSVQHKDIISNPKFDNFFEIISFKEFNLRTIELPNLLLKLLKCNKVVSIKCQNFFLNERCYPSDLLRTP